MMNLGTLRGAFLMQNKPELKVVKWQAMKT